MSTAGDFSGIELTPALSKEGLDEILKVKGLKISSIHSPVHPLAYLTEPGQIILH
jgi:hypothetical protein